MRMRIVVANEARPIRSERIGGPPVKARAPPFRSGDRNDRNGGADHQRGEDERADHRDGETLSGFETEHHDLNSLTEPTGPSSR